MSIVLIASPEHLGVLTSREDLPDAQAFADTEALRALEAITRTRPSVIALERLFAATSRGIALINRIKADPSLTGSEIRIVAHDDPGLAISPAPAASAAARVNPLDGRGTRDVPRVMAAGAEVFIDGNPATLVDASPSGLQVLSPTILKPNQRVRVTLPGGGAPIRLAAAVVWASFEMPKAGPRYRAGIAFLEGDAAAVGGWIATVQSRNRASDPAGPASGPPPTLP